jgi:hypothetical protein
MKTKIFFLTLLAIQSSYTFSGDSTNKKSPLIQTNNYPTIFHFQNEDNDSIYFKRKYYVILIGSTTSGGILGGLQPVSCAAGTSIAACVCKETLMMATLAGSGAVVGFCVGCAAVICYRLWNSREIEKDTAQKS